MIDQAYDVNGVAVLGVVNNLVRTLRGQYSVSALFLCSGVLFGQQVHKTQNLCRTTFVDARLVPKALCRTSAVAQFEDGLSGTIDPKNVDSRKHCRFAKAIAQAAAIAPEHAADRDILHLTEDVARAAITCLAAGGGTHDGPTELACLKTAPDAAHSLEIKRRPGPDQARKMRPA